MEITDELKQEACRLRREGVPCTEIAKRLGVCNASITNWTRDVPKKTISFELRVKIIELLHDGWKAGDVAMALGIPSVSTVYQVHRRYKEKGLVEEQRYSPLGWVLNHPYQFELQAPERERYREVVEKRREMFPECGCEYNPCDSLQ